MNNVVSIGFTDLVEVFPNWGKEVRQVPSARTVQVRQLPFFPEEVSVSKDTLLPEYTKYEGLSEDKKKLEREVSVFENLAANERIRRVNGEVQKETRSRIGRALSKDSRLTALEDIERLLKEANGCNEWLKQRLTKGINTMLETTYKKDTKWKGNVMLLLKMNT